MITDETSSTREYLLKEYKELVEVYRVKLAEADKRADEAEKRADEAETFKEYVHTRLDEAGVPKDPEPKANRAHGCRIEGRLNWILSKIDKKKKWKTMNDVLPTLHSMRNNLTTWIPSGLPGFQDLASDYEKLLDILDVPRSLR